MDKSKSQVSSKRFQQINSFLTNTDIRVLVIAPSLIGFGGFFIWLFIAEILTQGSTSQASFEIGLGIACLIASLAGVAEIYKQEMPGGFGKIIKGKIAVGSGIIIVLVFGCSGVLILKSGLAKLFAN
jgi:hypothetical protein